MLAVINAYCARCYEILVRPIYFYTCLKEENWQEGALTYLLQTSWLVAFIAALVVYVVQLVPIGAPLVEGISGGKVVAILPVLLVLMFVFFVITFLIVGGFLVSAFFVLLFVVGMVFNYAGKVLGGHGSLNRVIQCLFYSSAVFLSLLLLFALLLLSRFAHLDFELFKAGFNVIYYLTLLYTYGLWSIIIRRCYGIVRWKAFLAAFLPIIILLILGVLFDKIALPRFEPWVG
jgi:hypothetical protein